MYESVEDLLENLYDYDFYNYSYLDNIVQEVVDIVGEEKYLQLVNTELANGFSINMVVKNLYDVYI